MNRLDVESTVKTIMCAGAFAAGLFFAALTAASAASHGLHVARPAHALIVGSRVAASHRSPLSLRADSGREVLDDRVIMPGKTPFPDRPWIEGYEPAREDALFRAVYPMLPTHNILKVYVIDSPTFGAAGIRFSARVPHTRMDIREAEMEREAAALIRISFDRFPDLQTLDVWGTIPTDKRHVTTVESTVFSVSADRATYLAIRDRDLPDDQFLAAFGRVWIAPQVPR